MLDAHGVEAAIRHLIDEMGETSGLSIQFQATIHFDRAPAAIENAIYRIVQEALNNVRSHSGAREASVEVVQHGEQIRIVVADRGCGFDPSAPPREHHGLISIRDRARLLGGHAEIESEAGNGTRITVDLPLAEIDPADIPPADYSI